MSTILKALWWTLKLSPQSAGVSPDSLALDYLRVDELNPPEGYDPYTGLIAGSHGAFASIQGNLLWTTDDLEGRDFQYVFTREGEDVATCSIKLIRIAEGEPTGEWSAEQMSNAIIEFRENVWEALKTQYPSPGSSPVGIALDRCHVHRWGVGVGRPNPSVHDQAISDPATGDDAVLPPQVAVSVTFKTSRRRSWGRVYMPAPVQGTSDESGRIAPGDVELFRTAFGDHADSLASDGTPQVVWCARVAGRIPRVVDGHLETPDASSFAISVDQIQVDDLYDVIRSRRYSSPLIRETHTVG